MKYRLASDSSLVGLDLDGSGLSCLLVLGSDVENTIWTFFEHISKVSNQVASDQKLFTQPAFGQKPFSTCP